MYETTCLSQILHWLDVMLPFESFSKFCKFFIFVVHPTGRCYQFKTAKLDNCNYWSSKTTINENYFWTLNSLPMHKYFEKNTKIHALLTEISHKTYFFSNYAQTSHFRSCQTLYPFTVSVLDIANIYI